MEVTVKLAISLLSVMVMVSAAIADIPGPAKGPQLPPRSPYDNGNVVIPNVDPVVFPISDRPDYYLDEPGIGPNNPPRIDQPGMYYSSPDGIERILPGEDRNQLDRPVMGPNNKPGPDMPKRQLFSILPVLVPGVDRPGMEMDKPVGGPNDVPRVDRPGMDRPAMGPNDRPVSDRPVIRPGRGVRNYGDGVSGQSQVLPVVRAPQPFFRNRLELDFGPYRGLIKVELKMYDMNGRQVVRQDVVANGKVVIGQPVSSLAAGSYILQLDCGDIPFFRAKLEKVD